MFPHAIKPIARLASLCLVVTLFIISCVPDKSQKVNSPEIGNYIAAYTSGVISCNSEIIIRFTDPYPGAANFYEPISEKLMKFDPALKGTTYWIDNYTLGFKPEDKLDPGTKYNAILKMASLFDVSGLLEEFNFKFQTRVLDFMVNIGSLNPHAGQTDYYSLNGSLDFSDEFDKEIIGKILRVSQDGKTLPVQWKSMQNNQLFEFTVDSILRQDLEGELIVVWDGAVAGIDQSGNQSVLIPSKGVFDLLKVRVHQLPSQRVELSFSDQLKSDQLLDGLILLDGNDELKFSIKGNKLEIYADQSFQGMVELNILPGLQSVTGAKVDKQIKRNLNFSRLKPQVNLVNKGVILPSSQGLVLPFKAVGLNKVDIQVVKIFESNIPQFLQVNKIDSDYEIRRVGRPVLKHTIDLAATGLDVNSWNMYSIDLTELITPDQGAIYNIEFLFYKKYSAYECMGLAQDDETESTEEDTWDFEESSYWDNPNSYYWGYWPDYYDWRERENPCHVSYYVSSRFVQTNILASDIGLIAKSSGNDEVLAVVTNLVSTEPIQGASIDVYNFQMQRIGSGSSNAEGMVKIKTDGIPFVMIATRNNQKAYLRIDDGSVLSVSDFDVSGKHIEQGIKGYLYGDRGVWRPGDTLFLNFILDDRQERLPEGHPLVFELLNPHGRIVKRIVKTSAEGNIYKLQTTTTPESPTGNWTARVKVGGVTFTKSLRIETVKPNRLKVKLDFGDGPLQGGKKENGELNVKWLHGAAGRNLRAQVDMTLYNRKRGFEKYPGYTFYDPSRNFYPDENNIYEGRVDMTGDAVVTFTPPVISNAPGMLQAGFMVRAFEEGGDFSTDYFTMDYAPFETFVGIRLPVGDKRGMLLTDTTHSVNIITCDAQGNPVPISNLNAAIYKVSWRWWWNATDNDMASYFGSEYSVPLEEAVISTDKSGKATFNFKIEYPDWGRFFVRVWDPDGGAATGKTVYVDWPGWAGQAKREFPGAASLLTFTADKENYKVGEKATVVFPSSGQGRAMVSIESGSEVIEASWVLPDSGQTKYSFEITPEMSPNVFVHISIVQPHSQTLNDAPMRLYGIIPIMVEDPGSRISPVLKMADELEPEKPVDIEVYEENGMPMTYTIAMVDEGLLDLTRFKTPNPWNHFYAREALGVKTWDVYNYVIGAYGGKLEKVFGIGGGEELEAPKDLKANRFKPVVKFLGPFSLKKGESAKHSFMMPNYIGSVRTMIVAAGDEAYGASEKTTPVKKPLMLLATLPRVLGPAEEVTLPITVFAMDEDIKKVELTITPNEMFKGGTFSKTAIFEAIGDQVVTCNLTSMQSTGTGKVVIEARSGKHKASYTINIEVRNPNPPLNRVFRRRLEPGQEYNFSETLPGMIGSNSIAIEVASLMPLDLDRRLRYLIHYPHGCLEQTVSGAFPQLYITELTEVSEKTEQRITRNVRAALNKLIRFQAPTGGLRLWPDSRVSDWVSTYAGHFFLEAEKMGYTLPVGLKSNWLSYQQNRLAEWTIYDDDKYNMGLQQAYRLYTLALAGSPDLRAMNRLRETTGICEAAKWRLISAYVLAGQPEVAEKLASDAGYIVPEYNAFDQTYGSSMRDNAMILQSLCMLDEQDKAYLLAQKISNALTNQYWMSTQTTAFCLMAMATYYEDQPVNSAGTMFTYAEWGDDAENISNDFYMTRLEPDALEYQSFDMKLKNIDKKDLFVSIFLSGNPLIDSTEDVDNNITMEVVYRSMDGKLINPTRIDQGTDFIAEVSLSATSYSTSYRDMALTQIFPSGWEIINKRMFDMPDVLKEGHYEYRDIRDDRVLTYFSLSAGAGIKYRVLLNAAYTGRYYMPGAQCEAMYNPDVYARRSGKWVEVVKPE